MRLLPQLRARLLQPVNSWQTVTNLWRWQPLCVPLVPYGTPAQPSTVQKALTPQWRTVKSISRSTRPRTPTTRPVQCSRPTAQERHTAATPRECDSALQVSPTSASATGPRPNTGPTGQGRRSQPATWHRSPRPCPQAANTLDRTSSVLRPRQRADGRQHSSGQSRYQYDLVRRSPASGSATRASRYPGRAGMGYGKVLVRTGGRTRRTTWSPRRSPSTCRATARSAPLAAWS